MDKEEMEIRLARIRELRTESSFNYWDIMRYRGGRISVGMSASFKPYMADDYIELKLGVRYTSEMGGMNHDLLYYVVKFDFGVNNIIDHVKIKKGVVSIPAHLLMIMVSVGIGTLRGMLAHRTRFTSLDFYPLPILNVSEIVNRITYDSKLEGRFAPLFRFAYE